MNKDKQIKSTDWLTKGYTKEELATMKAEAIKEAEIEEMAKDFCAVGMPCKSAIFTKIGVTQRSTQHEHTTQATARYRMLPRGYLRSLKRYRKTNLRMCFMCFSPKRLPN